MSAIVHVAMFDAVNGISRRYAPLRVTDAAPPGATQPGQGFGDWQVGVESEKARVHQGAGGIGLARHAGPQFVGDLRVQLGEIVLAGVDLEVPAGQVTMLLGRSSALPSSPPQGPDPAQQTRAAVPQRRGNVVVDRDELVELHEHPVGGALVAEADRTEHEGRLDGRPTLLIVDEGWLALDDEGFSSQLREWLKTLRKFNVAVVFATQSLADVARSSIAPALIESCPTRIFLPNPDAQTPQITALSATAVQSFTSAEIGKLSATQFASLTATQIGGLDATDIADEAFPGLGDPRIDLYDSATPARLVASNDNWATTTVGEDSPLE